MTYVRDRIILDRIGCRRSDEFAVIGDTEGVACDCDDNEDFYGFSDCFDDSPVDETGNGYTGIKGYMHGDIRLLRKGKNDRFAELVGIFSADGMYKMESARSCTLYKGKYGRAACIAIPQCKMMNSTVLTKRVKHPVYAGTCASGMRKEVYTGDYVFGGNVDDDIMFMENNGMSYEGNHIPFDAWVVIGVVFGKALRVWRGPAKKDMSKMPSWMFVTYQEIYECLNPGCLWKDVSPSAKAEWLRCIMKMFKYLRNTCLAYDLPGEGGVRTVTIDTSILETTFVSRRVDAEDEAACMAEWNDVYEPFGVKVCIRSNALFKFCWRKGLRSPSVVQILDYEHDGKKILGINGSGWCFQLIWLSWLLQYRNYWIKHHNRFRSCKTMWTQKEMMEAFKGSFFKIRKLSSDKMEKMLEYHTIGYAKEEGKGRMAHIAGFEKKKRCVFTWTLPERKNAAGEATLVKTADGENIPLSKSGLEITEDVRNTDFLMSAINAENRCHTVMHDGRRVRTDESVIYRTVKTADGGVAIDTERNGRCYSRAGGIQSLHKYERAEVTIDGHKTVELDFSSLHPNMLYALRGLQFSGDVYDLGDFGDRRGIPRDTMRLAAKMMTLRMVNAGSRAKAVRSFKEGWNESLGRPKDFYIPWIYDLYDEIKKKHAAIADDFGSGKGVYLMNLDGRMIRNIMYELARDGICCLGIHDSVIVDKKYEKKAKGVMLKAYASMFNGKKITVK